MTHTYCGSCNRVRLTADGAPVVVHDPNLERIAGVGSFVHELSLDEVERRHILRVLRETAGNKLRAARILGIPRASLSRSAVCTAACSSAPSSSTANSSPPSRATVSLARMRATSRADTATSRSSPTA